MRRIFLIDSPGVVYDTGDDEVETVLKGVVRAERLSNPLDFIEPILQRVKKEYIQRQYLISDWNDHIDFVAKVAVRTGKLIKGGEPDLFNVAVHIINDWQRGKLPYFVPPPKLETDDDDNVDEELKPETETLLLKEVAGRAVLHSKHAGLLINIESGLGHLMNDEFGIRFKCGKIFTQAYRHPRDSDSVHMCLRCFPSS
jgi:hypothetical protein